MEWNLVEGNWKEKNGEVREKWGKLTEGDRIKLTKRDSGDGQHHFLKKRLVSGVEGNQSNLSVKIPI